MPKPEPPLGLDLALPSPPSFWGIGPDPAATPSEEAAPLAAAIPTPATSRVKVRVGGIVTEGTCDAEGVIVLDVINPIIWVLGP